MTKKVCVVKHLNSDQIYFIDKEGKPQYYVTRNTGNEQDISGRDAYYDFVKRFEEIEGKHFNNVFAPAPFVFKNDMVNLVPSPLNFGLQSDKIYHSCYKIDICSAYAYEASKTLPNYGVRKEFVSFEEPNEEYPFAYYFSDSPNGCGVSVYGEAVSTLRDKRLVNHTILCGKSSVTLERTLRDIFRLKEQSTNKKDRNHYKAIMNLFVGYCQRNSNPQHAYISAIVLARCNARVQSVIDYIEQNALGRVLLVNTDAVAWTGYDIPELYKEQKELGNFLLEHSDCKMFIKGAKSYQILDNDGTLTTIYAGVPREKSSQIPFGKIGIYKADPAIWIFDYETARYKQIPYE